jgi:glycerol uptake facilitator protein
MCAFGLGSVAQYFFDNSPGKNPISIIFAFGIAVMIAIIVTGKACGAHLNPSVTLALVLTGQLSASRFFVYALAQMAGAFLGAVSIYLMYFDSFYANVNLKTKLEFASVFVTMPNGSVEISAMNLFGDQVMSTCLLIVILLAVGDKRNERLTHEGACILIGFVVIAIGKLFSVFFFFFSQFQKVQIQICAKAWHSATIVAAR